jgi:hypothetical protein
MSLITIRCRLVASEANFQGLVSASEQSRQYLWQRMTTTTLLVNELLKKVALHPNFEVWQHQGKLPEKELKTLWESLKADPRYSDLPARFLTSAKLSVGEIYDSWLATQKSQRLRLDGITRWLEIIKSDADLVQSSGHNLEQIRSKAYEILTRLHPSRNLQADPPPNCEAVKKKRGRRKSDTHKQNGQQAGTTGKATPLSTTKQLFSDLFDAYCSTEESDTLSRCAISHLIKNGCRVNEQEEDVEKLSKRLQKKRKEAERLKDQLISRVPRGRDLDGEEFLRTLDIASQTVPQNEIEALSWQASLLKRPSSTPFPILFFSNADLHWSCLERHQHGKQEPQKRIFVRFKGLDKKYLFEVYCDRRQLPLFQQFLEDEQTYTDKQNQGEYSSSLFLLRSAVLLWREDEGDSGKRASRETKQSLEADKEEGKPWNQHRLYLHCTVETRCLSQQGTEQVKTEKANTTQKIIASYEAKEELSETQQQALKRKRSTLERLDKPFPRPSRSQYQGNADIIVGVSLGLDPPVAVAVVEASTGKTMLYQSTRQLLGEDYKLLSQYRHRQNQHSNQRHKHQSRGRSASITESNSGQYIDRLIARSIIVLAQAHQAGSIALPHMTGHRERLQSEITARAEQKFPGNHTAQDFYAKQYRISIHRWSYNRLIRNIQEQARKAGLSIEVGQQPTQGTLTQKAQGIAISAFHDRKPL